MIAVAEMPSTEMPSVEDEHPYQPSRLDSILRRWGEVYALAMNPYTARGLVKPNVETRDAPRFKSLKHNYHGDALTWAGLVADVELAWYRLLGDGSTPTARMRWSIIGYRMAGKTLGEIGVLLRARKEDVVSQHRAALREMAQCLGWVEPVEDHIDRQ